MNQEDQNPQIIIPMAIFKSTKNDQMLKSKIKAQEKILNKNNWRMDNNYYQKNNLKPFFASMLQCFVKKIYLANNNHSYIIKQIMHVCFPNLKELYLQDNNIQNIEPLTCISFPDLQTIDLGHNNISHLNCFNRISMPFLNFLYIQCNPINQMSYLTKSKIDSKQLKFLGIQLCYEQAPINQDLSFIVKLSSESIKQILVQSQTRISQPKIQLMLLKSRSQFLYIKTKNYEPW